MFYDKFLALCVERSISPTAAAEAIGMTGSHVTRWKRGSAPLDTTILKLAQYFNVPVDYFKNENKPTAEEGDGLQGLLDDERTLLDGYRTMTDSDKQMMQDFMRRLRNAD